MTKLIAFAVLQQQALQHHVGNNPSNTTQNFEALQSHALQNAGLRHQVLQIYFLQPYAMRA